MASIDDKTKTNNDRGNYQLPTNGPHRFVKKEVSSEKEKNDQPPYVVAIVKPRPEDVNKPARPTSKYDPREVRAKAQGFLDNPNISSHGKSVLKEILESTEDIYTADLPKINTMKAKPDPGGTGHT